MKKMTDVELQILELIYTTKRRIGKRSIVGIPTSNSRS